MTCIHGVSVFRRTSEGKSDTSTSGVVFLPLCVSVRFGAEKDEQESQHLAVMTQNRSTLRLFTQTRGWTASDSRKVVENTNQRNFSWKMR